MKLSLNRLFYGVMRGSANMAQILEFAGSLHPVRRDTSREAWLVVATITPDKTSVGYNLARLRGSNAKN